MATLQERYYDILLDRVRADRYPSHQLLDRVEASFWNGDQVIAYVDMLLEKVSHDHYPSHQLLSRIERMLQLVATVA